MNVRIRRADTVRPRWRRAGIVLVTPLLLAWSTPQLGVRVNHPLAPGQSIAGWGVEPSGKRVLYGVRQGGLTFESRQLFSAKSDGSQGVFALTALLPADRTIRSWAISADSRHVVFAADLDTNDVFELYSVTTDGAQVPVKLNGPLLPDHDVNSLTLTPDGSRVLYLTSVPFTGRNTLNSAPVDGSEPAVVIHEPEPGVYGFLAYRATSDSRRVLYWSQPDRILSARVDGSAAPIQISPAADALVPDNDYLLSPDGKWIVFYATTAGGSDVFSARVDGSAPARPLFFPEEPGDATEIEAPTPTGFQISGDSRHVVGITGGARELRAAPIDGSGRPVVLADPPDLYRAFFRIARDGTVVFQAHPVQSNLLLRRSLFAVPMDGSAPARQLNGFRGDARSLKHEIAPEGDVVFDGHAAGRWRLFTVPIEGGTPAEELHPLVDEGDVNDANSVNGRSFQLGPDGAWLLYRADHEQDRVPELFVVAPDGDPSVRKMNGPLPAGAQVLSYAFGPDSRRVFYSTWTFSTVETLGIFTSVIADDALARTGAAIGDPLSPTVRDESGTLLVEDPGRGYRSRLSMRLEDARRAAPADEPRRAPDERSGALARELAPRGDTR